MTDTQSRIPLDPDIYFEVATEDAHQVLCQSHDVRVVLKTQIRQLERIVAQYRERFGDLPSDDEEPDTAAPASEKEPAK